MRFDSTGKITLDHLYQSPDPRAYFRELSGLDYRIPQEAKPYFVKILREYRDARGVRVPRVLDLGCGYGINAALLKYDLGLDDLFGRYGAAAGDSRETLLARDRALCAARRPAVPAARVTGLDTSREALDYGVAAGFLDDAVHADLERHDPTPEQRALLAGTDLVISTGCIGYVTRHTLQRVVDAASGGTGRRPWMAHFVLRMFPMGPVEEALGRLGYETVRAEGVFPQRRFASAAEQEGVLRNMAAQGIDTDGLESEGRFLAQLYLSRPAGS